MQYVCYAHIYKICHKMTIRHGKTYNHLMSVLFLRIVYYFVVPSSIEKEEEYMFCASRINFSEPEMLDSEVSFLREEFSFLRSNYSFSRSDRCQNRA